MAASVKTRVRYADDLHAWSLEQAALLRARRTEGLDWERLAEELEAMVGRDRRELKSRLRVILLHLLKWQTQPARRGASWRKTLRAQRQHIRDLLQESPSLRPQVPALVLEAYPDAVKNAVDETGLPLGRFPVDCPYAADEVRPEAFLPDTDGSRV
ncbi:MAG TPA: DUF29 domain-containing protein [Geminicoccaceae bacterium]|nr:DUF29 domain-containing protein [Geminicoccaceae bacterium]